LDVPIHSRALLEAILSWLATVGIMSSCLFLVFPLSVSLVSLCLCWLSFSVSQTHNCARLLVVASTQSSWPKSTKAKLHGNTLRNVIIVQVISGEARNNRYGSVKQSKDSRLCALCMAGWGRKPGESLLWDTHSMAIMPRLSLPPPPPPKRN